MASNRIRRIQKELADMHADKQPQVTASLSGPEGDMRLLTGKFKGPEGTPYEGGEYMIDIEIPSDYPFKPPKMRFETKIWHPNVSSQTGAICLDTLGRAWSPVLTIRSALLSLQSLLSTPEPRDPQDAEVASMLLKYPKQFERTAREWAVKYAGAPALAGEDGGPRGSYADDEYNPGNSQPRKPTSYLGYSTTVLDPYAEMGFDYQRVAEVFERFHIPRGDQYPYQLTLAEKERIIAYLIDEH